MVGALGLPEKDIYGRKLFTLIFTISLFSPCRYRASYSGSKVFKSNHRLRKGFSKFRRNDNELLKTVRDKLATYSPL